MMTSEEENRLPDVEVDERDKDWIDPHAAAVVLARAKDGSKPIPWSQVEAELEEMDRLGI
jgi:hypothetical protein